MWKRIILIMLVSLFTLLESLSAYSIPQWARTHEHPRYLSKLYLMGVGTSSHGFDDAKDQARLDIAKQIKVQIKIDDMVQQMSIQIGEEYYYRREVRSRMEFIVDEELTGAQIVETSEEDGIFYALAVLDRVEVGAELELAIEKDIKAVNRLLKHADELLKNGNISGALADFIQAHSISCDITLKRSFYQAISPMPLMILEQVKAPTLILSQIRDILSRLRLVCISGSGQIGKIGEQLPEPLVVQLNMVTEEGEMIPVEGMEVQFEFSSKELIGRQVTDSNGKASVMITVPKYSGMGYDADTGEIIAMLALLRLPEELKGTLPVAYTVFHYGVEMDIYPIRLSILSEDGKSLPKLEGKVEQILNRLGYTVEKDARISLEGSLTVSDVKRIEGSTPQTLAVVEINLSILDAEEGAVFDSISFSGKGLAGSEEIAFQKGALAVKIDEEKVSTLLQVGKENFIKAKEKRSREWFEEGKQLFNAGKYKAALRKLEGVAVGTEFYEEAQKLIQLIMASMPPVPRLNIAIFEPRCDGSHKQREIAKSLRDTMTNTFIRYRELRVIKQERLEEIMKEIRLGLSEYVNQNQAAQIGRLAGADVLLLSSFRMVEGEVELDVRLIKTETGEPLAAATSKRPYDELKAIAEDFGFRISDFGFRN